MARSTSSTKATRNARMRGQGQQPGKASSTKAATPRKAKANNVAKASTKGKGKAKGKAKATPKPKQAKAQQATVAARRKPGQHGLTPQATGKLPTAACKALLAVPKAGKGNAGKGTKAKAPHSHLAVVYRSMRCQATGGPVATVYSTGKGQVPAGWLAVCLATGAYGVYSSRHAAATAMAYPAYHGA